MRLRLCRASITGAGLVGVYTGLISCADGITKLISASFAAPQLYGIAGLVVAGLCVLCDRHGSRRAGLRTHCPGAMALRSGATVLALLGFFHALRLLPLTDVFVFVGLMPILAGLMSGPILGEPVRPAAWAALLAACLGVVCLFPQGLGAMTAGHLWALLAAVLGTFSMVMARFIGKRENNALAQVFYPNLAVGLVMGLALPFVWAPMGWIDLGWILAYAILLFSARWLLVVALRLLPAYVVTPLMNLQFGWMVLIGAVAFGEFPGAGTYLGVAIVVGSGLFLVWDQTAPRAKRLGPLEKYS